MREYKNIKDFEKELNGYWPRPFSSNSRGTDQCLLEFMRILAHCNGTDYANKKNEKEDLKKRISGIKFNDRYYNNLKIITLDEINRYAIIINKEIKGVFELYNYTVEQAIEMFNYDLSFDTFVALYDFVVRKGTVLQGTEILKKYIEVRKTKETYRPLLIESDRSGDFIPLFELVSTNKKIKIDKKNFSNYVQSLSVKPTAYTNDLDKPSYLKFLKIFKDEFTNVTSLKSNEKESERKYFDLIESDMVAREKVIQMRDYEFEKIFRNLLKENPDKLKSLIIDYFNKEHADGKKSRTFVKTYTKVKEILEQAKLPQLEILKLNVKLQSLALQEMFQ